MLTLFFFFIRRSISKKTIFRWEILLSCYLISASLEFAQGRYSQKILILDYIEIFCRGKLRLEFAQGRYTQKILTLDYIEIFCRGKLRLLLTKAFQEVNTVMVKSISLISLSYHQCGQIHRTQVIMVVKSISCLLLSL